MGKQVGIELWDAGEGALPSKTVSLLKSAFCFIAGACLDDIPAPVRTVDADGNPVQRFFHDQTEQERERAERRTALWEEFKQAVERGQEPDAEKLGREIVAHKNTFCKGHH